MGAPVKKKPKRDHKALLAGAKLPERSVDVCLRADLFAEAEGIHRELQQAESERDAATASLASGSESRVKAEQLQAVRDEMLDHTLTLRFRALPRKGKRNLALRYPPREDNLGDLAEGVNVEAMTEALIPLCLVDPVFDAEDWEAFEASTSDGQWLPIAAAVWAINNQDVEVPFSRTASRIIQTSSEG